MGKKYLLILLTLLLFGLFSPLSARLLRIDFNSALAALQLTELEGSDLPQLASRLFNTLLNISIWLAVAVIIWGGLHYLVSFGLGKITGEGKQWIKSGIVGLIIIMSSIMLLKFINPDLIKLEINYGFPTISLNIIGFPAGIGTTVPTVIYKEYPIGILTENLLTRTADCYDFDENGDPIDGNPNTPGWEPTLMNHDRVDCILKLSEAAEKKAEIISELSEEIARLMEQCSCFNVCDLDCRECTWGGGACPRPEADGTNIPCIGDCVNGKCKGDQDCCPEPVRNQIEHGPILLKSCPEDPGKEYRGLDEFRTSRATVLSFVEEEIELNEKRVKVIKKDVWENARLIEQLMYLKEKLSELIGGLRKDLTALYQAEHGLTQCYRKKSFGDFIKIKEKSDKEEIIITSEGFKDPVSGGIIDASKYCEGFFYNNAGAFSTCQKICKPGLNNNSHNKLKAAGNDTQKQMEAFYTCADNSGFKELKECFADWVKQCVADCDIYLGNCAEKHEKCEKECKNNSSGFYDSANNSYGDNIEKCYLDIRSFKDCADKYPNNFDNYKKCAEVSFKCEFASDQYAGHPDCLREPIRKNEPFSSFYLYQNLDRQKCTTDFDPLFNFLSYPECQKCPNYSRCPLCPCLDNKCAEIDENLLMVSGECGRYAYNGDPLTFYCPPGLPADDENITSGIVGLIRAARLNEHKINIDQYIDFTLGKQWRCPIESEVPVGQTVDEAEYWAEEFLKRANDFLKKTGDAVQYIKRIGEERDYCQCDSLCKADESACKADCIFWQQEVPIYDEEGNQIGTEWICGCSEKQCEGNPCQKIINMLQGKTADKECPEGIEYKGVAWYVEKIQESLESLKKSALQNRSEALKRLIYSRKQMDGNIGTRVNFQDSVRLLNCERVRDENMPVIAQWRVIIENMTLPGYCYGGRQTSAIMDKQLMDNWFNCRLAQ